MEELVLKQNEAVLCLLHLYQPVGSHKKSEFKQLAESPFLGWFYYVCVLLIKTPKI